MPLRLPTLPEGRDAAAKLRVRSRSQRTLKTDPVFESLRTGVCWWGFLIASHLLVPAKTIRHLGLHRCRDPGDPRGEDGCRRPYRRGGEVPADWEASVPVFSHPIPGRLICQHCRAHLVPDHSVQRGHWRCDVPFQNPCRLTCHPCLAHLMPVQRGHWRCDVPFQNPCRLTCHPCLAHLMPVQRGHWICQHCRAHLVPDHSVQRGHWRCDVPFQNPCRARLVPESLPPSAATGDATFRSRTPVG